jgi:RNA polymerase sigma factor (TIGR02999 family)
VSLEDSLHTPATGVQASGLNERCGYHLSVDDLQRHGAVRELYDRLRAIARSRMSNQHDAHTLDPTSLANEAILRLLKCDPGTIKSEEHMLALAAEAMRQILVDHARAKSARKRGDGATREYLSDDVGDGMMFAPADEILAASEALGSLEAQDEHAATLVKLRLFAGLTPDEVAALLGTSRRTVERRWRFAIATLKQHVLGSGMKGWTLDEPAN